MAKKSFLSFFAQRVPLKQEKTIYNTKNNISILLTNPRQISYLNMRNLNQ